MASVDDSSQVMANPEAINTFASDGMYQNTCQKSLAWLVHSEEIAGRNCCQLGAYIVSLYSVLYSVPELFLSRIQTSRCSCHI